MNHLILTLLVSSFVIPLILTVTLFLVSKGDFPKKVVGFALLNTFYVFLANYFYFHKLYETYSYLHSLHIATVLWIFPSIYLYIKSVIAPRKDFKKELVHLIPGFIFGITSAIIFYGFLNFDERVFYLSSYRGEGEFTSTNLKVLATFRLVDVLMIIAQVIYYSITFFRLPRKYHDHLNDEYSNIDRFSINWLKWFNSSFVLVGLLCILFYVFNPFKQENDLFLVGFLFIISAFTWVIGIWSFKQEKPDILKVEETFDISEAEESLSGAANDELSKALIQYFEEGQAYLNPNLNLTMVCKEIGTNRTYLSNLINSRFEMNFSMFVNKYRLRHVQKHLRDHPDTPMSDLAHIGGFGSVSSLKRSMANQKLNQNNQ